MAATGLQACVADAAALADKLRSLCQPENPTGDASEEQAGQPFDAGARAGVQIDAATFAQLVEMADRLRMAPSVVLRLALRALVVELERQHPRKEKLLGAKRQELLLEAKR